jgi:SAM-dependent methyltransferase
VETLAAKNLRALRGSAENLPKELAPCSFDGVVFSHVLEHLVDPVAAVRSAAKLLKPGGVLFCEVPNNESRTAQVSGLSWEHLDIPRHINFFTEKSLLELGRRAGLKAVRTYFTGYCRLFDDSYIATEQRIHDNLPPPQWSTRNSEFQAWRLLASTAAAHVREKYDSVGVVLN